MSDAMNHQYNWEVVGICDSSKPKSIEWPTNKEDLGQVTLKIHTHTVAVAVSVAVTIALKWVKMRYNFTATATAAVCGDLGWQIPVGASKFSGQLRTMII